MWLLRLAFGSLLGAAPASGRHHARTAGRVRLTNSKTDEREVLVDLVTLQPNMFHHPDG